MDALAGTMFGMLAANVMQEHLPKRNGDFARAATLLRKHGCPEKWCRLLESRSERDKTEEVEEIRFRTPDAKDKYGLS